MKAATTLTKLRVNLADYPVTKALRDGRVTSDIVELDFCGPKTAHDGFKGMVQRNDYDAGELAIVTFLQARCYDKPYVLLPFPVSGRSQHHCIGYNAAFGTLQPKDIEGRKVGVRSYAQTTGLWVRGILQHDYDVDLDRVTWLTVDDAHLAEYKDPVNCERLPKGSSIAEMMLNGEVAAAILGNDMPQDPRISALIPDVKTAATTWYEREGIIPINHMFAIHSDIARNQPDVVREIFRMLVEMRAQAPKEITDALPPVGLEAIRKNLQMAIDWSYDQKIIPRILTVDELFDDTTAGLIP